MVRSLSPLKFMREGVGLCSVLVLVLLVISAFRNPALFSASGFSGAVLVAAPLILASVAITPIAIVGRGGVDLSIGPLVGFINVTIVTVLPRLGLTDPIYVFGYAILAGVLWQACLAAIISYVRIPPIIASLAGYLVLQGVNLVILPRPGGDAPEWLSDWGFGTDILSPVLGVVIVAALIWEIFRRTSLFQQIRLTGAEERMAYAVGVNTVAARWAAHIAAGMFAGLAAVCLTGLIGSGDPSQGNTLTLQAVTALVLGGTSLAGGRGGAYGSALAAIALYLIFGVLSSINFGSLSGFATQLCFGVILVMSLMFSSLKVKFAN